MSKGGPAGPSAHYANSGGPTLPWLKGGPPGMRAATKPKEPDEDTRSWAGFEKRHHANLEPLSTKGPAFWSKSAAAQHARQRARPARKALERGSWFRAPYLELHVYPWLYKVVYFLVILALALFFILISLISAFLGKADNVNSVILRLAGQQQRLAEAVRDYGGDPQSLKCVLCQGNWMQRADACYLFTTQTMSWKECVGFCQAQQASILIGDTEGEMVSLLLETRKPFLAQNGLTTTTRYWIGLMYNKTKRNWFWADGTHLHIKMSVTEKKNLLIEDVCILFHEGHEDVRNCFHKNHCLCKRKAP